MSLNFILYFFIFLSEKNCPRKSVFLNIDQHSENLANFTEFLSDQFQDQSQDLDDLLEENSELKEQLVI